MRVSRAKKLVFHAVGAAWLQIALGGNSDVFTSMPASYFNEADWQLLRAAVLAVTEAETDGVPRQWENSKNGHRGAVTSLRAFQSKNGRDCRLVRIDNAAEGFKSSMQYNLCRDSKGVWRDAASGTPFTELRDGAAGE